MDSELSLRFIGNFPDYLSALSHMLLNTFLDNLCRNSCISPSHFFKIERTIFGVIIFQYFTAAPFKMMSLIFRLAGQFWQMESTLILILVPVH